MDIAIRMIAAFVPAYLIGAVSFALIYGKLFHKIDLREHGSGNLGATNVQRVLGWRAGLAVLLLDMAKGAAAVWLAELIYTGPAGTNEHDWMLIGAAIAAVIGHSYSPYIRFKGGKGVATASGALLFITPAAWLAMLVTFVVVIAIWKMVSLGSISVAVMYPVLCLGMYRDRPVILGMSFLAAAVVLWRHRSNMARIARGQEAKITDKGSAAAGISKDTEG